MCSGSRQPAIIMLGAHARRAGDLSPIASLWTISNGCIGKTADATAVRESTKGRGASRRRIERLMRHHGIRASKPARLGLSRVRTTDGRHDVPIAPNLLDRNFVAAAPNQIWLADIS
jgi:transposase InsO family protein